MILKSLNKLKKNNKGSSSIEMVISVLIFILLLCFLLDLLILSWKFSVISQTTTQVARIAGIQGGVLSKAPSGWAGGSENYITAKEMDNMIRDKFASAKIPTTDYEFRVGNGIIGGTTVKPSREYDYKTDFDISVTVNYRWDFVSNFIPGNLKQSITSKRIAMSEWKYNYNDWIGE